MVQYRLWLHHREVDQHLRRQQQTYKQEIAEIDERIARIEKMAMQIDNTLLTALIQQLNTQEHTTSQITDTTRARAAYNGATQASLNNQIYQTPPPSNYGQQGREKPQPLRSFPASSTWGELPNFATQDIDTSKEKEEEEMLSLDAIPVLPEKTGFPVPSDPVSLVDYEPQKNELDLLPWWLRHLMQPTPDEQELPQTAPLDQQSIHTNQRVERWLTRRIRLVHYDEQQESERQ